MSLPTGGPTLLRPEQTDREPATERNSRGLPRDLVQQATQRLRVMALLYAAVYFLVAFFPPLISITERSVAFEAVAQWLPGTIAISVALFIAAVVTHSGLSPRV